MSTGWDDLVRLSNRFWLAKVRAALAATAAATDWASTHGKSRHTRRTTPVSTYWRTSAGSVSRANAPQLVHW